MEHRDEYDDLTSPHSCTESQWNPPPPRFQEDDEIHATPVTSHVPSGPDSPPRVSPPLPYDQEQLPNLPPQSLETHKKGCSTEKETPSTPDFSGPQVVPGQFSHDSHGIRSMSLSSHGETTTVSPIRPYGFKEHVDSYNAHGAGPQLAPPQKDDRKCGLKKRTFIILISCVIIVAISLGLGLGLGLGLHKDSDSEDSDPLCREKPDLCIGGSLNVKYISQKGAFNGSGIALAGESWNKGQKRIFTLYFQHHTGDIRSMQYDAKQQWLGGTKSETVASDAKNATPISAVSFSIHSTAYFYIFYIGRDNMVKQRTQDNITGIWEPGPLNNLNLKAFESPTIGLQACWTGDYYGSEDPTTDSTASSLNDTERLEKTQGINIWFPISATTFEQYVWQAGHNNHTWKKEEQWTELNGRAGVGCFSWGNGTTTYTMMSNPSNTIKFYWRDTNNSLASTKFHPINEWTEAPDANIPNAYPITSLGYTDFFYVQMQDRTIKGFNITFQAENTTFVEEETFLVTDPAGAVKAIGGTHFTVTAYMKESGTNKWDSLSVFFQKEGDDITHFMRPTAGGPWTGAPLDIPDD